jgi:hypothetical protein
VAFGDLGKTLMPSDSKVRIRKAMEFVDCNDFVDLGAPKKHQNPKNPHKSQRILDPDP